MSSVFNVIHVGLTGKESPSI